ncbi:MAG: M1 family aminopeptidase [Planctomycetota bacterium]
MKHLLLIALLVFCVAAGRQYAPDPQVDYTHLALEIDMRPSEKAFDAVETLSFKTLGVPLASLELDAVGMTVGSVEGEHVASFRHDGERLLVRFEEPLEPRTEHEIVIEYAVVDPADGMKFALPDEAYPDRPLHVHTQGQPESNRHWVICHDYPNDFLTTEMKVTVPDGLKVLANGEQLAAGENGVWHYRMQKPHVTYLMSLVVGEFDVVRDDDWRGRRIEYWVPPGRADDADRTFGRTEHMLDWMSDKLGIYPWEAYSQSVVYLFESGGMENTTVTTMFQECIVDERAAIGSTLDGLVAHELAHQWFGDQTTCRTWGHLWLNEGFATFLDHAWHEAYHGPDEYAYEVFVNMRRNGERDDGDAEYGLVWPEYDKPIDTFRRRVCNPYGKGAAVIHMLREFTGDDDAFWEALKLFQTRHAHTDVETDELRHCFEEVTGRSYDRFFQQWIYEPGTPKLHVTYAWDDAAGAVKLTFHQTQSGAADEPFIHDYPVTCVMPDGQSQTFNVTLDAERNDATLATGKEPALVALDPEASMIQLLSFDQPLAMTLRQATEGPTAFARLRAIERLATSGSDEAVDTLLEVATDNERHWSFQAEAARSLGRMDDRGAMQGLLLALADGISHPRARLEAVEQLGNYRDALASKMLVAIGSADASIYVEAAALAGLGKQAATDEIVALLLDKTNDDGHGLRVRSAAVGGLANLGLAAGIEPAKALADYGTSFRARTNGFTALATLYPTLDDDQKAAVRLFLEGLVNDPQERHARNAVRALGDTLDEAALPRLRRVAESAERESVVAAAKASIAQIESGNGEPRLLRSLQERLDRLEESFESEMRVEVP